MSRNIRPQSSQLADLLQTDPGITSGISVHALISDYFFFFKARAGNEWRNTLPKILASEEKATAMSPFLSGMLICGDFRTYVRSFDCKAEVGFLRHVLLKNLPTLSVCKRGCFFFTIIPVTELAIAIVKSTTPVSLSPRLSLSVCLSVSVVLISSYQLCFT